MKKSKLVLFLLGFASVLFLALSFIITYDGDPVYFSGFVPEWAKATLSVNSPWHDILTVMIVVLLIAAGYFAGSMNFAIMISKEKYGDDIRKYGSGNAGMTNMIRVYGKKAGLLTLLGDSLKTSAVVLLGRFLAGESGAYIAGLFCVLGHIAPVWYKFKGEKGLSPRQLPSLSSIRCIFLLKSQYLRQFISHPTTFQWHRWRRPLFILPWCFTAQRPDSAAR